MFDIIKNNSATFYDYSSNVTYSIRGRLICFFVMGLLLAVLTGDLSSLVNSILTVLAILLGFSFNVMIFLTGNYRSFSTSKKDPSTELHALEEMNTSERLQVLVKEIFYNVVYFNLVTLICLIICLGQITPINVDTLYKLFTYFEMDTLNNMIKYFSYTYKALLFFCLIESMFTFARISRRINYLFQKFIS